MSPLTDEHPRILSSLTQPGYRRWLAVGCACAVHGALILPFFLSVGMALDVEPPTIMMVEVVALNEPEPPQAAEIPAPAAETPPAMPEAAPETPPEAKPEPKPEPPPPPEPKPEPKPKPVVKPKPKPSPRAESSPSSSPENTTQTAALNPALSAPGLPTGPASGTDAERFEPPRGYAGYLNNPPPPYPEIARKRGWEGLVLLTVSVSADGHAEEVQIKASSGYGILDERALETVKKWRFSPAQRGGRAVAATVDVPLRFRLTR